MIDLYLHYFKHPDKKRQEEIDYCILKNIENDKIDKIYILLENEFDYESYMIKPKVEFFNFDKRLNFEEIFNFVNSKTNKDTINIVSNVDIYFDDSLRILYEKDLTNKFIALTRWDVDLLKNKVKIFNVPYSQDTWIWRGKILINENSISFNMGVPSCDNIICGVYKELGYDVINPAYELISYHLHSDVNTRQYSKKDTIKNRKCYTIPPDFSWKKGICNYWMTITN